MTLQILACPDSLAALRRRAARLMAVALIPLALAACGGSDDDDEVAADNPPEQSTPDNNNPPARNTAYLNAKPGDILRVRIEELIPTQPSIGYDQIYYKLGRWQGNFDRVWSYAGSDPGDAADFDSASEELDYINDTVGKKFDDYCEDTGQHERAHDFATLAEARAARLDDPATFECDRAPGVDPDDLAAMKTVVIGWDGNLYLTDGHHSFSALREIADGGPKLQVYVKVDANYSNVPTREAFWQVMADNNKTWLFDGDNNPITVDQLPKRLGLANDTEPGGMGDDRYRSLVYFTRDIAYVADDLPEFAEFLWGDWLRRQVAAGQLQPLSAYDMIATATPTNNLSAVLAKSTIDEDDLTAHDSGTSYAAAVRDAALRMNVLGNQDVVYGSTTAAELGHIHLAVGDDDTEDALGELEDLARNDIKSDGSQRGAGKLWYAAHYRACGAATVNPGCWGIQTAE